VAKFGFKIFSKILTDRLPSIAVMSLPIKMVLLKVFTLKIVLISLRKSLISFLRKYLVVMWISRLIFLKLLIPSVGISHSGVESVWFSQYFPVMDFDYPSVC